MQQFSQMHRFHARLRTNPPFEKRARKTFVQKFPRFIPNTLVVYHMYRPQQVVQQYIHT
jgi:hypothetical protein